MEIRVNSGISQEAKYATDLMKSSPTGNQVFQHLKDSKDTYSIQYGEKSLYDPNTRTIYWNLGVDIFCFGSMDLISSEVLLMHELIHAFRYDRGLINPKTGNRITDSNNWVKEEMGSTKLEKAISKDLGLPARWSYFSTISFS